MKNKINNIKNTIPTIRINDCFHYSEQVYLFNFKQDS